MNCKICGKPLSPKQKSYCSAECAIIGRRQRQRTKVTPRYCAMCGKLITGQSRRQYCSDECMKSGSAVKPKKVIVRDRIKNIKQVDKLALQMGVSYGKYVAMQYLAQRGE